MNHASLLNEKKVCSYLNARNYRAPELFLGYLNYGLGVDMWAVGCVIAEMVRLKPLFWGEKSATILERIVTVAGGLSAKLVERYSGSSGLVFQTNPPRIQNKVVTNDTRLLSLVCALLNVDDQARLSAAQCLDLLGS